MRKKKRIQKMNVQKVTLSAGKIEGRGLMAGVTDRVGLPSWICGEAAAAIADVGAAAPITITMARKA